MDDQDDANDPENIAGEAAEKAVAAAYENLVQVGIDAGREPDLARQSAASWLILSTLNAMPNGEGSLSAAIAAAGNGVGSFLGEQFCCLTHLTKEISTVASIALGRALSEAEQNPDNLEDKAPRTTH